MGMDARRTRRRKVAVAGVIAALAAAGSATAFQQLPANDQVNNDPGAGINPTLPLNLDDPANADVVGGSLVATKPLVPWAIFRQTEASGNKDQVFSRSFAGGAWTTRGNGTVGGSSASPTFSGSLNFDQGQDGEAPSIDFAGAGRTVPWASWYEHTTGTNFGADNIFASKFDNTGDANQNKWIFAGQGRGSGGATGVPVPSLNIHTNRDAVNPVVQGGATVAGNDPVPWVTWQEEDGNPNTNQIFVSKGVKPATGTICPNDPATSANPIKPPAGTGAEGGFCFQQVGIDRLAPDAGARPVTTSDPSLNVDRTRDGIEPDMAFTGANDTVPWVVWYEQNNSTDGLHNNEMVFAAKATTNGAADGQFQWTAVGLTGTGVLDNTAHGGACGLSPDAEAGCSVNANPNANAEDPRVASGTMTAGNPTVPWVVWDEGTGAPNDNSVFVARLVGVGAAARFVIANGGQPVGTGDRADITFSGNTPYVTWHHNGQIVTGHFSTPDAFQKDSPALGANETDAVRAPISSGCIATPFNGDGASCQAGALGTPFLLFTDGNASNAKLFADAYQPTATTAAATGVGTTTATLNGTVNPSGAFVNVQFQFGPTAAYGQVTGLQKSKLDDTADAFSAQLTGLAPGKPVHYRIIATTDFGTVVGADQTLKTASALGHFSVGHARVRGTTASVRVSCTGIPGQSCRFVFRMTVTERLRGHKLLAVTARKHKQPKIRKVIVTVGTARGVTLASGQSKIVSISLNGTGKRLLASRHTLKATFDVTQILDSRHSRTASQNVTFHKPKPKHKKHH